MEFIAETTADGVSERLFTLGEVPGVLWTPAGAGLPRPLVLMGHGGGQHKKAPGILTRARHFVTACGFAVAAIDAPGHGDRPLTEAEQREYADLQRRIVAGQVAGPELMQAGAERAARALPEWIAVLDALQAAGHTAGPVGYWGVSMGAVVGVPLAAAEPRIVAAVFGLVGDALAEAAGRVTVPIEFLLQWDDELVSRASGLALFDAFGSAEKTLHANPGRHGALPAFELDSSASFFRRRLSSR